MDLRNCVGFAGYTLDLRDERLWYGQQPIELTPKAFALLSALASRSGQLMTKDELFRLVWPQTVVSDATLTQSIRELRQALGDDARSPLYIETVHGRGYRFIAQIDQPSAGVAASRNPPVSVVGRDAELARLDEWLRHALNGQRQLVLISGEAGIGKTTLVQTFLERSARELPVALGRCIEQFGASEAYLPVLEALERLGQRLGGARLGNALRKYAPSWLVQLPALTEPAEREQLQRQLVGITHDRMLREIAQTLEVLSGDTPIVLWLEDLHWSDYSTLDLLSCIARRSEPAHLMVLTTYRPLDVHVRKHPLREVRQELALHGLCRELALAPLSEAAVEDYLRARLGAGAQLGAAAHFIHGRTEGNPLFMVSVIDDLTRRDALRGIEGSAAFDDMQVAKGIVPENLRQLIERQFERLSAEDRHLLEAASVAGVAFSAAAVAAVLDAEPQAVDERCLEMARANDFLLIPGEAGDTRTGSRYRFGHAFHREVVYDRLDPTRRAQLHLAIGTWQEHSAAGQVGTVATELAMHFDRGRDPRRAVSHLRTAAENALRQSAHAEATALIRRALELLEELDDARGRAELELALQLGLGAALLATKGFGAPEVGAAYGRARTLMDQADHSPHLLLAAGGLITFYVQRSELRTAHTIARQCMRQAREPVGDLLSQSAMGTVLYCEGDFLGARGYFERVVTLYPEVPRDEYLFYGRDPGVVGMSYLAGALWHLGYFDQAWQQMRLALRLAGEVAQPFSTVVALLFAASLEVFKRSPRDGMGYVEQALGIANEQQFPFFIAAATILEGYFLAQGSEVRRGIEAMQRGLAARNAAGGRVLQPFYLGLLSEAYTRLEDRDAALNVISDALSQIDETGERGYEAELYRLKGLALARRLSGDCDENGDEAEGCFLRAREIARAQHTRGWELRATMDLARLQQRQGRTVEAQRLLADTYAWFSEGFDTPDMMDAAALLRDLQGELPRV